MVRIHAFTISFPPRRFIGSEIMTARLLEALAQAGHDVAVNVGDGNGTWQWRDIPVSGSALTVPPSADVVVVHAGRSWPGVEFRRRTGARLVMICHNTSTAVLDDVHGAAPDLVIVNSQTMADEVGVDALIVNPPAPAIDTRSGGDRIVALSLNDLKGGRQVLDLAELMPQAAFLAVRSGYGEQEERNLPNLELLEHVPHDELTERVWSRAGVFLQLSASESWGMAASEALAHAVPVIAHPTPGIVENLGDAATYVDRDDVHQIAATIADVLADRAEYSSRALARASHQLATSRTQMAAWVSTIEGLQDVSKDLRNRAASGAL